MLDLSAIESIEIQGSDFLGRRFAVISNERIDTGEGALRGPIMPIPETLLNIFGTPAVIRLNGNSAYDPLSGEITKTIGQEINVKVYAESYTLKDKSEVPEIKDGDIKVYVPGRPLGYTSVALLIFQVRDTGSVQEVVS